MTQIITTTLTEEDEVNNNDSSLVENSLNNSSKVITGMYISDSDSHNNNNNMDKNSNELEVQLQSPPPAAAAELQKEEIPLIDQTFPTVIVWKNVALFIYLHLAAVYGAYLFVSGQVYLITFIWGVPFYTMNGLGITAGCHRLWCHKTYKAKLPLRLLLTFFQTVACQNSIYEWCQDHRVHHKFSETNADPHNSNRGFFFAHMGWLMCKKHPAVKVYGKKIDMSDLANDPIVAWQKKYYLPLVILIAFVLPIFIPVFLWGESWAASWFFTVMFRYCVMLHFTWLVNSVAHLYGNQPYDRNLNPRENKLVAILALGEGWHNYHHTFPWDYKTAELGNYRCNLTTGFLDFMARIGWAYDLKTVPMSVVLDRVQRTGDGTHLTQLAQLLSATGDHDNRIIEEVHDEDGANVLNPKSVIVGTKPPQPHHHHHVNSTWGWDDKDISEEDIRITERLFQFADEPEKTQQASNWKKIR